MWWIIGIIVLLLLLIINFLMSLFLNMRMSANVSLIPLAISSIPELKQKDFDLIDTMSKNLDFCSFIPVGEFRFIDPARNENETTTDSVSQTTIEIRTYLKIYLDPKLQTLATIYICVRKKTLQTETSIDEELTTNISLGLDSTFIDNYEVIGTTKLDGVFFPTKEATRIYCTDHTRLLEFIQTFQNRVQFDTQTHPLNPNFLDYDIETYLSMSLKEGLEILLKKKIVVYDSKKDLYRYKLLPSLKATFKMAKFIFFEEPKLRKAGCCLVSHSSYRRFSNSSYLVLACIAMIACYIGYSTENNTVLSISAITMMIFFALYEIFRRRSAKKFVKLTSSEDFSLKEWK